MFSGIFIAEKVEAIGEKGFGDTTMIDVQTPLEAFFEHINEICLFQWQRFLLFKSKTFGLGTEL